MCRLAGMHPGTGFAAENAAEASDQMFSPFVRYHLMDSLPVLTPV